MFMMFGGVINQRRVSTWYCFLIISVNHHMTYSYVTCLFIKCINFVVITSGEATKADPSRFNAGGQREKGAVEHVRPGGACREYRRCCRSSVNCSASWTRNGDIAFWDLFAINPTPCFRLKRLSVFLKDKEMITGVCLAYTGPGRVPQQYTHMHTHPCFCHIPGTYIYFHSFPGDLP